METMILQTICGAVMVLIGAVIARGWPDAARPRERPVFREGNDSEDVYARDLAAMMEYPGEKQEDDDEA
ncbi:MAG: hypothetical protein ACI3XZ_05255 [Butyricicoccus sp.]